MNSLCVFCGSSTGVDPAYMAAARSLGDTLARRGIRLVYGGASIGLMGAVADAALAAGGEVTGVIPRALFDKEVAHVGLPDLRVVATMHERKALMAELSEGFIALPGGIGTFEELFEIWTWGQLGFHDKPFALYNVAGFYDGLARFLDDAVSAGFLKPAHRGMITVADSAVSVLQSLFEPKAPAVRKW